MSKITNESTELFKVINEKISKKFTDPDVRNKLCTCVKNPHEYTYLVNTYMKYKIEWARDLTIEWKNMLYIYPNRDNVYNTFNNVHNIESKEPYSIRLDHRHGGMFVMAMYDILMLDFDMKDYEVKNKYELKTMIDNLLTYINTLIPSDTKKMIWHYAESDKGYHVYLVNYKINYKDDEIQKFMTLICSDILYAAFTSFHGICVRLSKKEGRSKDYVAKVPEEEITIPYTMPSGDIYMHNEERNMLTVDNKIIDIIVYQYNLIDYFKKFSQKYIDILLYNPGDKGVTVLALIREHIDSIKNDVMRNTADKTDIHDKLKYRYTGIDDLFNNIKEIVEPTTKEKSLIVELSGGNTLYYNKNAYSKHKNKYLYIK